MNLDLLSDNDLVNLVQKEASSEALNEILRRHSGIYVDIVSNFLGKYISQEQFENLQEDRMLNIYNAVMSYEPDKSKLSTYIGIRAKYLCLAACSQNKLPSSNYVDYTEIQHTIQDESKDFENAVNDMDLSFVWDKISNCQDDRIKKIFNFRYKGIDTRPTPWKDVAQKIGLSVQGCINIHNKFIEEIKEEIKDAVYL